MSEQDLEAMYKATVLIVAAFIYPRIVCFTARTESKGQQFPETGGGATVRRKDEIKELDPRAPAIAFDAAEAFVKEAAARGFDLASLAKLVNV